MAFCQKLLKHFYASLSMQQPHIRYMVGKCQLVFSLREVLLKNNLTAVKNQNKKLSKLIKNTAKIFNACIKLVG